MTNTSEIERGLKEVLGIELTKPAESLNYDDWLELFRKVPAGKLLKSQGYLQETLPLEGFAAAARWIEIIGNPTRMDKLYRGRLRTQEKDTILDLAIGDDEEAFYEALIIKTTRELEECTGNAQEVARLTMNLKIFRAELHEARSRKPKKDTVLAQVLELASKPPKTQKKRNKSTMKAKKKTAMSQKESNKK